MTHPAGWTPERVDRLKALWREGWSASQIAADLEGGVTRNAVISQVHKLIGKGHLERRMTPTGPMTRSVKASRPKIHGNRNQPKVQSIISKIERAQKLPVEPLPDDGVDVTHLVGMSFEEAVDAKGCMWCDGDPLTAHHAFCGKPRKAGSRWCPEHYARVYIRPGAAA